MATIAFTNLAASGIDMSTKKKPEGVFFRAKSKATVQQERIEGRYDSKTNRCGVCFVAKSKTGLCNCD